jgi:hypothetical protein
MPITEVKRSGRPLRPEEIEAVEQRLGVKFPLQYVRFLLAHNGGRPHPDTFRGLDPDHVGGIHFFFSIDGNEYTDLVTHVERYRERGVRLDLMPIARTPSGMLICLGVGPVRHGEVFFWAEHNLAKSQDGWRLAEDLDSFLATFHEFDESEAFT